MASYKEWLYAELCNDGILDENESSLDDVTTDNLLSTTELEEFDLENYREQFEEHCEATGEEPKWDVD